METSLVQCLSLAAIHFSPPSLRHALVICMLILLTSLSPHPFLFYFLSLPLLHRLSLPGNLFVRTPWYSGSGSRSICLLPHGFLKRLSLSAAWYVLCPEVFPVCTSVGGWDTCARSCRRPITSCHKPQPCLLCQVIRVLWDTDTATTCLPSRVCPLGLGSGFCCFRNWVANCFSYRGKRLIECADCLSVWDWAFNPEPHTR